VFIGILKYKVFLLNHINLHISTVPLKIYFPNLREGISKKWFCIKTLCLFILDGIYGYGICNKPEINWRWCTQGWHYDDNFSNVCHEIYFSNMRMQICYECNTDELPSANDARQVNKSNYISINKPFASY